MSFVEFPASTSGPQLTVNTIIKQPTFIKQYLLTLAPYMFVGEKIFRHVQDVPSGVVVYRQSTPLFVSETSADLAEFEEIPAIPGELGKPLVARTRRKGLAVMVSEQMRTRNDIDALNLQLMQIRNTLIRDFDGVWMAAMDAAVPTGADPNGSGAIGSHVVAAATSWSTSSTIRADIGGAAKAVTLEKRGFRPDGLLIDQSTYWGLLSNANAWQVYQGNVANLNPQILGRLPGTLLGLTPYVTMDGNITAGAAYVFQQGIFGGIADERPLSATPWYEHRDNESWRSNVTRVSASFVDQPLAIAKITAVR